MSSIYSKEVSRIDSLTEMINAMRHTIAFREERIQQLTEQIVVLDCQQHAEKQLSRKLMFSLAAQSILTAAFVLIYII